MPVDKDNIIEVEAQHRWALQEVAWRYMLRSYADKYYRIELGNNQGGANEKGLLFVRQGKVDDFKKLLEQGGENRVKVTDAFVYGQKKDGRAASSYTTI